jgi:Chlorophyll A-B binding protein
MRFSSVALLGAFVMSTTAFSPRQSNLKTALQQVRASSSADLEKSKTIFDPLGLYPDTSPERLAGVIEPLERQLEKDQTIIDPLSLYQDKTAITSNADMSASLPFLRRPQMLDGSLPGDRGFDPFNFSSDPSALTWYRDSEIKHARLAMLAAAGWPIAELFHKAIASNFDLQPILALHDKVPSVLNGGLALTPALFWVAAIQAAATLEAVATKNANDGRSEPGDYGFDPLGYMKGKTEAHKFFLKEAEIFNGRIAMLAITGFALQEWLTNMAVVDQTPIFFKPFWHVVAQLLESGAQSV